MNEDAALPAPQHQEGPRVAELLLIALVFAASLALAIGVPLAWLWLASKVTGQYSTAYVLGLLGAPVMMVLWARLVLGPLNRAYLRTARHPFPLLEASVTISVVVALAMLVAWAVLFGDGREVWGPWPG
jgi:hypothetical protein